MQQKECLADLYEQGLPDYLQHDLDAYKDGQRHRVLYRFVQRRHQHRHKSSADTRCTEHVSRRTSKAAESGRSHV